MVVLSSLSFFPSWPEWSPSSFFLSSQAPWSPYCSDLPLALGPVLRCVFPVKKATKAQRTYHNKHNQPNSTCSRAQAIERKSLNPPRSRPSPLPLTPSSRDLFSRLSFLPRSFFTSLPPFRCLCRRRKSHLYFLNISVLFGTELHCAQGQDSLWPTHHIFITLHFSTEYITVRTCINHIILSGPQREIICAPAALRSPTVEYLKSTLPPNCHIRHLASQTSSISAQPLDHPALRVFDNH